MDEPTGMIFIMLYAGGAAFLYRRGTTSSTAYCLSTYTTLS
jgi:hypothetical protein